MFIGYDSGSNTLLNELQTTLWQPIAQQFTETLGEALMSDLGVLHIATHGRSHQFPLRSLPALAQGNFDFVQWPGVPYMRLACDKNSLASRPPEHFTSPWQIAHDCSWTGGEDQPIPMAAVESQLISDLFGRVASSNSNTRTSAATTPSAVTLRHGKHLARLSQGIATCCHGTVNDGTQSALRLGSIDEGDGDGGHFTFNDATNPARELGAPLVILPVCHGGDTREDRGNNALGMAAGFLLAGSRVVVASSKAVPDPLMPIYSSLLIWHYLNGQSHYAAAIRARAEFAKAELPQDYRDWLAQALPGAAKVLHPTGDEVAYLKSAGYATPYSSHMKGAIEEMTHPHNWPWGQPGESYGSIQDLLMPGLDLGLGAPGQTQSYASAIGGEHCPFNPHDPDNPEHQALREQMRDMAAFIHVMGV